MFFHWEIKEGFGEWKRKSQAEINRIILGKVPDN